MPRQNPRRKRLLAAYPPDQTCAVESCSRPCMARNMCAAHYQKERTSERPYKPCSIDGCKTTVRSKGWYSTHYWRWFRNGDPLIRSTKPPAMAYSHSLYGVWAAMKRRCNNPRTKNFNRWGGRCISVCERWKEPRGQGFLNFLADMGE